MPFSAKLSICFCIQFPPFELQPNFMKCFLTLNEQNMAVQEGVAEQRPVREPGNRHDGSGSGLVKRLRNQKVVTVKLEELNVCFRLISLLGLFFLLDIMMYCTHCKSQRSDVGKKPEQMGKLVVEVGL